MKALIVLLSFLVSLNSKVLGQLSHSVTLGPDIGFPTESLGASNVGFGGSIEYRLKFPPPIAVQLHAGYIRFNNESNSSDYVSIVPIRLGVVGTLYRDIFFVFADAGNSRYHSSYGDPNSNGFSFGLGAGYNQRIAGNQLLQVAGYYNMAKFKRETSDNYYTYDWFSIRIAYGLTWGKGKN
jgi:hypothetical protein